MLTIFDILLCCVCRYAELQLYTPCSRGAANELFKLEADGTLRSAFDGYQSCVDVCQAGSTACGNGKTPL